jgi:hypothetical protein
MPTVPRPRCTYGCSARSPSKAWSFDHSNSRCSRTWLSIRTSSPTPSGTRCGEGGRPHGNASSTRSTSRDAPSARTSCPTPPTAATGFGACGARMGGGDVKLAALLGALHAAVFRPSRHDDDVFALMKHPAACRKHVKRKAIKLGRAPVDDQARARPSRWLLLHGCVGSESLAYPPALVATVTAQPPLVGLLATAACGDPLIRRRPEAAGRACRLPT